MQLISSDVFIGIIKYVIFDLSRDLGKLIRFQEVSSGREEEAFLKGDALGKGIGRWKNIS